MRRETWNVSLLGLSFCLIWAAINAQALICGPVLNYFHTIDSQIPDSFGFTIQAYITCVFTFGNIIVPSIVALLGSKWSLILGSVGAPLSMLGFLFVNIYYFMTIATLTGLGIGIMWGAMGEYVALNSKEGDVERNSGIVWMATMFSSVVSGIFLLVMFVFNPGNEYNFPLVRIIFGGLFVVGMVGTLILVILQPKVNPTSNKKKAAIRNSWNELSEFSSSPPLILPESTFRMLFTWNYSLLIPISFFSGLEMGLMTVTFPTAVQFTQAFTFNNQILVALISIAIGMGEILAGVPLSFFNIKRFSYSFLVNSACFLCCGYCAMVFIIIPSDSVFGPTNSTNLFEPSTSATLVTSLAMGMMDSTINVILLSYICRKYDSTETKIAYSLKNLLGALGMMIGLFYGTKIDLNWQLLILAIFAIFSGITFAISERLWRMKLDEEEEKEFKTPFPENSPSLDRLT